MISPYDLLYNLSTVFQLRGTKVSLMLITFTTLSLFSKSQDMAIGDAILSGPEGCGRLTSAVDEKWQAGAFWSSSTLDLTQPFDYTYETFFGCITDDGGDGLAFVLHQDPRGTAALGAGGGFMGYAGAPGEKIEPSVIIEFDTYDGSAWGGIDVPLDHVAIQINGDQNSNHVGPTEVPGGELEGCGVLKNDFFTVRITWNPVTAMLKAFLDGTEVISLNEDIVTNYFSGNSNVYWGWTSGTGDASNEQWICPEGSLIPWECSVENCCDEFDVTFNSDSIFCSGGSVTLSLVESYAAYEWSTGATTSTIEVNQAGNYSVVVIQDQLSASCPGAATIEVVEDVVPLPFDELTDTAICNGNAITLQVGDYATYSWSTGETDAAIVVQTAADYFVTVTTALGCSAIDEMSLTVHSNPIINLINDTICAGESLQLQASGGLDYLWSTQATTQSITVIEAAVYSVTVQNENGCKDTSSMELVVHAAPEPLLINSAICEGDSLVLNPGNFASYLWSTGQTSETITAQSPLNYSVTVVSNFECSGSDNMTLTIHPTPVINLANDTVCSEESVQLQATDAIAYLWSTNETTQSITVLDAAIYSVTVENDYGCRDGSSMELVVHTAPEPLLTNSSICGGDSLVLYPGDFATYLWSTGQTNETITASSSADYTVTVTSAFDCSASATMSLMTHDNPAISLSDDSICWGEFIQLQANAGMTYLWSTQATTSSITVSQGNEYSVTVQNEFGCVDSAAMTLTVIDLPEPTLSNASTCSGFSLNLDPGDFAAYRWSDGTTTRTYEFQAVQTTVIQVETSNEFGCFGTAAATLTVFENPVPVISSVEICPQDTAVLDAGRYTSYSWIDGSTDQFFSHSTPGTYAVTVSDTNGCYGTAQPEITTAIAGSVGFIATPESACEGSPIHLQVNINGEANRAYDIQLTTDQIYYETFPGKEIGKHTMVLTHDSPLYPVNVSLLSVRLADYGGCAPVSIPDSNQVSVEILKAPSATVNDLYVCHEGDQQDLIFTLLGSTTYDLVYSVDGVTNRISDFVGPEFILPNVQSGTYTIDSIIGDNGCLQFPPLGVTGTVINHQLAPAEFEYVVQPSCEGFSLVVTSVSEADAYVWNFGHGLTSTLATPPTPSFETKDDISVTLTVSNAPDCSENKEITSKDIIISDVDHELPNVFTPGNNDGYNDLLVVDPLELYNGCLEIVVYDRWGVIIFDNLATPEISSWDGNGKTGNPAPAGVYYYVMSINGQPQEAQFITLIR